MAGSSEMHAILTRNSPGPGSGTGPSSMVKSARVAMPLGRRASLTIRLLMSSPALAVQVSAITHPQDTGVKDVACGATLKLARPRYLHSATRLAALLFKELFRIGACCGWWGYSNHNQQGDEKAPCRIHGSLL